MSCCVRKQKKKKKKKASRQTKQPSQGPKAVVISAQTTDGSDVKERIEASTSHLISSLLQHFDELRFFFFWTDFFFFFFFFLPLSRLK
jgi:hypothetical protein